MSPFVVHVDPTPVPVKAYAESMGCTAETLVRRHAAGDFPPMRKIGGEWYVLPALVLKWSLDGDEATGREMASDVGKSSDEEAGALLQPDKRRGRRKAKGATDTGMLHPLETYRKTG